MQSATVCAARLGYADVIAATPRGDRDGDGEDVVGEERRGGDESGHDAEVLPRDGVRAAAAGIGEDRLPVREGDEDEQPDDDGRDRDDVRERDGAEDREDEEGLLGGVGDGGDRVGREDGEGRLLVQPLMVEPVRCEGPAEEESLEARERVDDRGNYGFRFQGSGVRGLTQHPGARTGHGPKGRDPLTCEPKCVAQSGRPDSNRRRPAWEAGILPTELRPRGEKNYRVQGQRSGVRVEGPAELRTPAHSPCPSTLFSTSQRSGLNRRPLDYESSALPLSYAGECSQCPGADSNRDAFRHHPLKNGVSTNFTTRANP